MTDQRSAANVLGPYSSDWQSCDGHCYGEIRSTDADGYWPAMVLVEIDAVGDSVGMTLTIDDARALAAKIEAAASRSDYLMRVTRSTSDSATDYRGRPLVQRPDPPAANPPWKER